MINDSPQENWQKVKLGDVALLNPQVTLTHDRCPYIPMEDLDWSRKYTGTSILKIFGGGTKFVNGDILFARITPCLENGKIGIARLPKDYAEGFGSTEYFIIRGREGVTDTDFLYYLCKTNTVRQTAINSMVGASGRQRANINSLENYEFNLPSLPTQQKIASVLSAFDDKIDLNNKIAKNLEETAQTIFKEWFQKNQKSKIKDQKLGDLVDIQYGNGPASSKLKKNGYPVYGANGVIGCFDSYFFLDRQIIVGCRGVVGNVTLTLPQCVVTHNSLIITPKNNRKIFFYFLLKNQNLDAVVGGSAQPQITITDFEGLDLALPEEKLQDEFESIAVSIEQKRLMLSYENQKLAALRDLLLPKLMSGEIKI